jgi:hypothetical protein
MSTNRTNLVGALLAVGALGATAGMMAWRWSHRHRMQRASYHRDLTRWEDEGGALATSAHNAAAAAPGKAAETLSAGAAPTSNAARQGNGSAGEPWPFPHGNA